MIMYFKYTHTLTQSVTHYITDNGDCNWVTHLACSSQGLSPFLQSLTPPEQ